MPALGDKVPRLVRSNVLLACLCVAAVWAFAYSRAGWRSDDEPIEPEQGRFFSVAPVQSEKLRELSDMPDPSSFRHIRYSPGMAVEIDEPCSDSYIAVLVYESGVDYRSEPARALFNAAEPCAPGSRYVKEVTLDSLHLEASSTAYVIAADEGEKGAWYNPR